MNENLDTDQPHDYMHDILSLKKLEEWGSLKFVLESIIAKKKERLCNVDEKKELFRLQGQIDGIGMIITLVEGTRKAGIKKGDSLHKENVDKYMKDA